MNLREYIKYEVSLCLLEIRGSFKWEEFKALQTLEQKYHYVAKTLQGVSTDHESSGGSRAAFVLSNRYVLKIARPNNAGGQAGIAQNKAEVEVYTNPEIKNVVPAIYDKDPNFHWIVSELVRPIKNSAEFEKIAGIKWEIFIDLMNNWKDPQSFIQDEIEEKQAGLKKWMRSGNQQNVKLFQEYIKGLQGALKNPTVIAGIKLANAGVGVGDIAELKHWAKASDGRLVILDTGLTKSSVETLKKVGAV